MAQPKSIAVLGVGKLGEALVSGLLKQGRLHAKDIRGADPHPETSVRVKQSLGIEVLASNTSALKGADLVILAVKPQNMDQVLREIAPALDPHQVVVSVATGATTSFIQARLGEAQPVVRAMPNTPALINEGMTGLCAGLYAKPKHIAMAESVFACVGRTVQVDEGLMDAVTALSASGPAFLYVVIESLAEAGVKLGIPRHVSTLLAAQTMLGAARMTLETGAHPALLKDMVTTPAGCTVDGLMELEEGKLRVTLIKAVVKAAERARCLVPPSAGGD
ncbi:MAG: pyrroline-5-carboxylate reductase [Acidobacteria bacterium]|nr:pyrroline-5-carboxylate reductase [Acidobacteriota bacterium]